MERATYLTISGCEGHPCRRRPERHHKRNQATVLWSSCLGGPDVDGATEGERGADLSQDGGRDPHKDTGDDVRRPKGRVDSEKAKKRYPLVPLYHIAAGPPARIPRKKTDLPYKVLHKQRSQAQSPRMEQPTARLR